ncbi:hypothetical protein SCUCBS95973_003145 [Sporothrix curviconia]|uniref:C6 zinc finger domain containing protein n=1 Tax=Sporothrix curviconia TaxID=1260050 RepID=A0ABP0BCT5_9PEZI
MPCDRCFSHNVACYYQDKGVPGRPRKEKQRRPEGPPRASLTPTPRCTVLSPVASDATSISSHMSRLESLADAADVSSNGLLGPLSLPPVTQMPDVGNFDFDFDFSFPIELFGQCPLVRHSHDTDTETSLVTPASTTLSPPSSPAAPESCTCANEVSTLVRALRHRTTMSHAILGDLRAGAGLVQRLLTCLICYNVAKAPRLTIENVLLIGRLMTEMTTGYRRYLRWVRATAAASRADSNNSTTRETVYLDLSGTASFQISPQKMHELIVDGLQADATRLTDLGAQFALRQHNRHMVGHESCPADAEGRCWRERYDVDNDPLDICPRNAAARTLTPCYRVVDAIQAGIHAFAAEVGFLDG